MRPSRALVVLAVVVISGSAHGQHHGGQSRGAPAPHQEHSLAGADLHHMMTPELQRHFMMQQSLYEMMILDQTMLAERRGRLSARNTQARIFHQPPGANRKQESAGETFFGGTAALPETNPSGAKRAQPPRSGSPGGRQDGRATQPGAQTGGQREEQQTGAQTEQDRANRESRDRHDAAARVGHKRLASAGISAIAADAVALNHLRLAHRKLQEAKHDYEGHRQRAMQQNENALRELGSPAGAAMDAPASSSVSPAQSDHILQAARRSLHLAQATLRTRANRPEQHRRAEASIAAAINEIDLALSVK